MHLQPIELVRPHRHGGRDYQPGMALSLPAHKAEWLIALGVAQPKTVAAAAPAQKTNPKE